MIELHQSYAKAATQLRDAATAYARAAELLAPGSPPRTEPTAGDPQLPARTDGAFSDPQLAAAAGLEHLLGAKQELATNVPNGSINVFIAINDAIQAGKQVSAAWFVGKRVPASAHSELADAASEAARLSFVEAVPS